MNKRTQFINDRYEALMFAKTPETARKAARELVRAVIGDDGLQKPLDQALRECCKVLRPSQDPKEEARFEAEFLELAFWPNESHGAAAAA